MIQTNKKVLIISLFILTIIIGGATIARFHTIADIPSPDQTPHLQLNLRAKNFTPNKDYILSLETGDQIILRSTPEGELNSSVVLPYKAGVKKVLRLFIQEKDPVHIDTPSLELTIDTNNQKLTWKGRYFLPSEKIIFNTTSSNQPSKDSEFTTDWNGHFTHGFSYKGIDLIKENTCLQTSKSGQEVCLSFDIQRSPELTEILTIGIFTQIFGLLSNDPFSPFDNWLIPDPCEPADDPFDQTLALCDPAHVLRLQEDLSKTHYDFTRMTLQLSAGMMQQVGFIGLLFDGKHQLETQLLFWEKQERAHDDYHPSEQICTIASMTKGLAAIEARRDFNTYGITRALSYEDQSPANTNSSQSALENYRTRLLQFQENYCAPSNISSTITVFCDGLSAGEVARMNRDIDFANLVGIPKTLQIDITDGVDSNADEEDVMSMGRLLFGNRTPEWPQPNTDELSELAMNNPEFINRYQEHRSLSAIRNVARHSYANMVGMKSQGTGFVNTEMRGILTEFGMPGGDIDRFIGENPSYFAQMHVLTKQVFQHPNFYTNLITKEANITRFEVTMEALQLMAKRDRYEAALRKEMLLSLLIEMKLRDLQEYGVDVRLKEIGTRNKLRGRPL